jgi:hypothetical protein
LLFYPFNESAEIHKKEKIMAYFKYLPFMFLLFTPFISVQATENKDVLNHYRVTRSDYTFSTVFDMATEKKSVGSVIKSVFHLTTHYDSYDHFGLYEGTGICRLLCLGVFYVWATEIDLYDEIGQRVGMIDGQVVSSEPAKFSFYNAIGQRVAIGYLDQNFMSFSLVDPHNSALVLARLNRNFILDTVDNWDVVIYHPELIPPQLVKIFAAFVCDTQTKFKPDL